MLVYAAGAFYVLGLLITQQVILRLMVLTGTCFYLLYYSSVAEEPLWETMYISLMIGLANIIDLASLLTGRSKLAIPRKHADIYPYFASLPPGAFRTLMRNVERAIVTTDTALTVEGQPLQNLYFVVSGSAYMKKADGSFERLGGIFVGEVAYLTDMTASATTTLAAGSELLTWNSDKLRATAEASTPFMLALGSVLSLDMARKVSDSIGPNAALNLPAEKPQLIAVSQAESSLSVL